MKNKRKIISVIMCLTLLITLLPTTKIHAATNIIIPTDVQIPSSDCTILGIEGSYLVDIDNALNRINEIRYEACKEGVLNPQTGLPLTINDYVPIKWSYDLEYIARIRAAEASMTMGHVRTNGSGCFNLQSPLGVESYGEVLAWNWSKDMIYGINQWYDEKNDWVNQNKNAVTGHYTIMISPKYTYVGLGTFCTKSGNYYNTTAGEFCTGDGLDETHGTAVTDCIQLLEVEKSALSGTYSVNGNNNLKVGDTTSFSLTTNISYDGGKGTGLYILNPTWNILDEAVATIESTDNASCTVKALTCGKTSIQTTVNGKDVMQEINVIHDEETNIEKATTSKNGSIIKKCKACGTTINTQTIYRPKKVKLSKTTYKYDGKIHQPNVTITDAAGKKISKSNYTLSYSKGCKKKGTYRVTIKFKGNYTGKITKQFTIK